MKNKILFVLIVFLSLFNGSKIFAEERCSSKGYSVFTINGIFTDKTEAIKNKNKLESKFSKTFNNEPLKIDYLYNPTHLNKVGDMVDAATQGVLKSKSDYDLVEMLNDASKKVTTQKILLVGHSQGNFYANNFYEKIASKPGGVPSKSIGVYGVGSPADYVAGQGKYLTSDTDKVISAFVGKFISILPPNIHIEYKIEDDPYGHSFSNVYLKYKGTKIVSDIKSSLDKLKENDEQDINSPCISPPKLTLFHKVQGLALNSVDYVFDSAIPSINNHYLALINNTGDFFANVGFAFTGLFANAVDSLPTTAEAPLPDLLDSDAEISEGFEGQNENSSSEQVETERKIDFDKSQNPEKVNETQAVEASSDNNKITNSTTSAETKPVEASNTIVNDTINNIGGGGGGSSPKVDSTPPVITILGINPVEVFVNSTYSDEGATANDETNGSINVVSTGTVDTSVTGVYTITYTATDLSNNISTLTRTVNVIDNKSSEKRIKSFTIPNSTNTNIDEDNKTVNIFVPFGTDITSLVPTITISDGASIEPNSNSIQNFTNPIIYKVTAENASVQNYSVSVIVSSAIIATDQNPSADYLDTPGNLINGSVLHFNPIYDTPASSHSRVWYRGHYPDASNIISESNSLTNIDSETLPCGQICNVLAPEYFWVGVYNDSKDLIHYTEVHYTGEEKDLWNHYDIVAQENIYKDITQFSLLGLNGIINKENDITFYVPSNTDIKHLVPTILHTGASINPASLVENDFSAPQKYTVTAKGGSTKTYTVTVVVLPKNFSTTSDYLDMPGKTFGTVLYLNKTYQNHGRVWYRGHFGDTSNIISTNNYPSNIDFQSLGCGQICGPEITNGTPAFYWIGIYPDANSLELKHFSEIYDTGKNNALRFELYYQGDLLPETCSDGIKNQNETGIDTGGVCSPAPSEEIPLTIASYTLNGVAGDITINPTDANPLLISLNSSKDVDWKSVKVENTDDPSIYRMFLNSSTCVDGTNSCSKSWNGGLSSGGVLKDNTTYKIRVHMQDALGNDYEEYLPSLIKIKFE